MSNWFEEKAQAPSAEYRHAARQHTAQLTKPPGSLGVLEELAVELAAMQGRHRPGLEKIAIAVFAADHGVAEEGVSAFPQAVTAEMVRNFSAGGAAISVLARQLGAVFTVVNVGTVSELETMARLSDRRIAAGTANFTKGPAMTAEQLQQGLLEGRHVVDASGELDCFIGGEMGIANTCSASALVCALLKTDPAEWVGSGTGVDAAGICHKAEVIGRALQVNASLLDTPLGCLQAVAGFEISALVGAYIRAAQRSVAVLVDGFICTAAALAAQSINASVRPWLLFSHQSAEAAHGKLLTAMEARPLLQLDMRLGEGSGAAVALPIMQMACALHNEMASFEAAGVSRE